MKKLIIILCLLLISCTNTVATVEEVKQFHPPRPSSVDLTPPTWLLLTKTTRSDIIKEEDPYAYMCVTWEDYIVMSQNVQNIIRSFKDYNALLCYYREDLKEVECTPIK